MEMDILKVDQRQILKGDIMIGLEYIVKVNIAKFIEIAEYLDVSKKTINDWVKGRRKIPKDRIDQLSQYFNLEGCLFQKELDNQDKILIHQNIIEKLA